jgi:LIM domain/Protein DA1
MICAGCKQEITGEYTSAVDAKWHPGCFRCADCGLPLGKERFYQKDGQPYHANCYHQRFSPRCAGCGQVITSRYITALGKAWHEEHFVCTHCGRRLSGGAFYNRGDAPYCYDCYLQLFGRRCMVCTEPIKDSYIEDSWGNQYCERHIRELPRCFSCGRLICERLTGNGQYYEDGRSMCNICWRTAITGADQGQQVMREVRQTMAGFGLDLGDASIPLRLLGQHEMDRRASGHRSLHPTGLCCNSIRYVGSQEQRYVQEILILWGLPREHFEGIAAHELCHAWLFLNDFPQLESYYEEGLCELTEYVFLQRKDTYEARHRMRLMKDGNNNNPVYGGGFHAALLSYDGRTLRSVLNYVRKHRRFP